MTRLIRCPLATTRPCCGTRRICRLGFRAEKGRNPAMVVRGLQNGQPISSRRLAHRRVGADAANKLVIFACEHDEPCYFVSLLWIVLMSNAPSVSYSCRLPSRTDEPSAP